MTALLSLPPAATRRVPTAALRSPSVGHAAEGASGVPSSRPVHLPIVDQELCEAAKEATERDGNFWSSPHRDRRESVHSLFQYPAMMVPIVQRRLVDLLAELQPGIRSVVDPFVGAATSLVAAMPRGLDCYGYDVNPLAVLVSRVKTGPFFTRALHSHLEQLMVEAKADQLNSLAADFPNLGKWFEPQVAVELSRLRRAIQSIPSLYARRFFWVCMAETVRVTSNDRTSTYKLHVRPAAEIQERELSPLESFAAIAARNIADMQAYKELLQDASQLRKGTYLGQVKLTLADVTKVRPTAQRFDLLISSPPYGDNTTTVTYGQHSYLPLQWIDLDDIDTAAEPTLLRTTHEIDRRSLGGKISRRHLDDIVDEICPKSRALSTTLDRLKGMPADRVSRVACFYRDLDKAIENIFVSLQPNAYMAWVVGNRTVGKVEIPTDRIITELLAARGAVEVTQLQRTIHHKRMPRRNGTTSTMGKERIVILRRPTQNPA